MAEKRIYNIGKVRYNAELSERFLFPFPQLNYLTAGAVFDRMTLITSATDSGKTTLTSQIVCEAIRQGYKVCAYLGEDGSEEASNRFYRQVTPYSPDKYIRAVYKQNGKDTNIREWKLSEEEWNKAHDFFDDNLFLFNIKLRHNVGELLAAFDEGREQGCKVFVVDNFENVEYAGENENKNFKDIAIALRDYAVINKVHIIAVAHLRKMEREVIIPDINDVKGSSAVANTAKNVLVLLRLDKIDKSAREYKRLTRLVEGNGYNIGECDSVILVEKTKGNKLGAVGLKYDSRTNAYTEAYRKYADAEDRVLSPYAKASIKDATIDDLTEIDDDGDMPF